MSTLVHQSVDGVGAARVEGEAVGLVGEGALVAALRAQLLPARLAHMVRHDAKVVAWAFEKAV